MARASLSAFLNDASGTLDGLVVFRRQNCVVLRRRAHYRYPKSPAQMAGALRLRQGAAVWNTLTAQQADAWNDYATTLVRTNHPSGEEYSPIGRNVFLGLVVKFLQISPDGEIPLLPPAGDFLGDSITLSASGVPGGVAFTASGPNAPGVATELLVQALKNERQKPTTRYKSAGFVAFVPGHLTETRSLEPGWYAVGYRFVEPATGQSVAELLLGKVQVV